MEVATLLEYGTSSMSERRHFRNSIDRKEKEILENINNALKQTAESK
jgi:hypothetical protein